MDPNVQISLTSCLPKFLPLSKPRKASGRIFESLRNGLAILQLLLCNEPAELRERLGPHFRRLADDKTLHLQRCVRSKAGFLSGIGEPS